MPESPVLYVARSYTGKRSQDPGGSGETFRRMLGERSWMTGRGARGTTRDPLLLVAWISNDETTYRKSVCSLRRIVKAARTTCHADNSMKEPQSSGDEGNRTMQATENA